MCHGARKVASSSGMAFVRPAMLPMTKDIVTFHSRGFFVGMQRRPVLKWKCGSPSLRSENSDEESGASLQEPDFEPTWTYVPYDPSKQQRNTSPGRRPVGQRRPMSTWTVPKTVTIPEDKLEISFVRSSGAGGQNVNKVNTKVELRVNLNEMEWIPKEVRGRLKEQQANRINKEGYLSLQSQEFRTQAQNRKAAVSKLQELILQAWPRPKIRKQRKGISKAAKERNKEFKRKRSETKKNRKRVDW